MSETYREIVEQLRSAFWLGERQSDSALADAIRVTTEPLRSQPASLPIIGRQQSIDLATARQQRCKNSPSSVAHVLAKLTESLEGCPIAGHPQSQVNVIPPPTIPSLVGGLLPALLNANLASEESSGRIAQAEVEVAAMIADLVGYDPSIARGVFTFGGAGTLLYAVKIGIEKACPGSVRTGLKELPVIVCSERAHYACRTAAAWLGLGEDNVIEIPTSPEHSMRPCLLESICRDLLRNGRKIAAIIGTVGTTDAFGLDDLAAISDVRERLVDEFSLDYVPHLHADAVIGWAWSVFNDYDFDTNPLSFEQDTLKSLRTTQQRVQHLALADSLGVDFHKTGFTAYSSSLFLSRDITDFDRLQRATSAIPYLFQSGTYHPALFTLETSRGGSGPLAALANLLLFGKDGLRSLLGHAVFMAVALRKQLAAQPRIRLMNPDNHGPVTLFRVYPSDVNPRGIARRELSDADFRPQFQMINDFNRRVFHQLQQAAWEGPGVMLSLTECCAETDFGEPIVALKSYVLSPFNAQDSIDLLLATLEKSLASDVS